MAATVHDVHHRDWKTISVDPAEESVQPGISKEIDAARAHAIDTARIAFAPSFDLSFVPSALIMARSTA